MVDRVILETPETGVNPPTPTEPDFSNEPNRPAWLPKQFKNEEAFAKSWTDQRAEITRLQQSVKKEPNTDTPPGTIIPDQPTPVEEKKVAEGNENDPNPDAVDENGDTKGDGKPTDKTDAAKKAVESVGLDVTPFQDEYNTTGDVSEANRAKIADGLKALFGEQSRAVVDQFIEGQKLSHANDQRLYNEATGGEENYRAMTSWAKQALTKEDVAAYNRVVSSGDRHATLIAIEGLKSRYEAANGKLPSVRINGTGVPNAESGYSTTAQMVAEMKDPRYKTDEAYRQKVARKIAVSNFQ